MSIDFQKLHSSLQELNSRLQSLDKINLLKKDPEISDETKILAFQVERRILKIIKENQKK